MRSTLLVLALLPAPACAGASSAAVAAPAAAPAVRPAQDGGDAAARGEAAEDGISFPAETFRLPNGLWVAVHEDDALPKVVVDSWVGVGSRDEPPGRTGFAHLFEHLMFMGTERVPGNSFDVIMESGGGSNNASTSQDRTNYFSEGPSSLLPTLLWLDADRFASLPEAMTQEKLDTQRGVVRNERRQRTENTPYGIERLLLPELLYPKGHPYHHPVIGSHEDLEAATVDDVLEFFRAHYVPANTTLVVAGDADVATVRPLVERMFGAIPASPAPTRRVAAPVTLPREVRHVAFDRVQYPKLTLAWHAPAWLAPGDGEMDLVGEVLGGGPSSRLHRRLVLEDRLAQSVVAYQSSSELGSTFHVEALAAPGVELDAIRDAIDEELDRLLEEGPSEQELARARTSLEASFLRQMESLFARADRMNAYMRHYGEPDAFQRDLERWTEPSRGDVLAWARRVLVPERVDLRTLPRPEAAAAAEAEGDPLARPDDLARADFEPPAAEVRTLSNGAEVVLVERPGTGLVAGTLVVAGGVGALPAERAGLAQLAARMLEAGAGGRDAAEMAEAAELLGASLGAGAGRGSTTVSMTGLASRLPETLDLLADLVLRPNLTEADFERERDLQLAAIRARADDPQRLAGVAARELVFGPEHPAGVPLEGYVETVEALGHGDVAPALERLLDPERARFVFAGDVEADRLVALLEERFAGWEAGDAAAEGAEPLTEAGPGRVVLFDRPGAPQTVLYVLRPVPPADERERVVRQLAGTVLGGSFTSRLNQNLRERNEFTYGAFGGFLQQGRQPMFLVSSAVHTPVTGAALREVRKELDAIAGGDVAPEELAKAVERVRSGVVESYETTGAVASTLASLVDERRPLDAPARTLDALASVTLDEVNAAASSGLLAWDTMTVVLVGDAAAVRPQLEAEGFEVETREVDVQ